MSDFPDDSHDSAKKRGANWEFAVVDVVAVVVVVVVAGSDDEFECESIYRQLPYHRPEQDQLKP